MILSFLWSNIILKMTDEIYHLKAAEYDTWSVKILN